MGAWKLNLAVFISGRGSNMGAIIKACEDQNFPAQVGVVISNRPDAPGLKTAADQNIRTEIIDHKEFESKAAFETKLHQTLGQYNIDMICLAGFMRLLSGEFLEKWPLRVINIHPSLLPAYKGLNVHERVLSDNQTESGCSVHYVTAEMDGGPVIVQKKVPVMNDDTPASLAERILEQEHAAYPEAIKIAADELLKSV